MTAAWARRIGAAPRRGKAPARLGLRPAPLGPGASCCAIRRGPLRWRSAALGRSGEEVARSGTGAGADRRGVGQGTCRERCAACPAGPILPG